LKWIEMNLFRHLRIRASDFSNLFEFKKNIMGT
jgi:hypothetical protein